MPYKEGEPIPDGYRLGTEKGGRGLTIAGISVFGGAYFLSLLGAFSSVSDGGSNSGSYAALFIPVIGPWIVLGTDDSNSGLAGIMVLDGLAQAAGATMFIIGMATGDKKVLKRVDVAQNKKVPQVFVGPKSAALRWTF